MVKKKKKDYSETKGRTTDIKKSLEGIDASGEGFWAPKERKNVIRILPPWKTTGEHAGIFYFKSIVHYGLENPKGRLTVPCLRAAKKPCPICEYVSTLKDKVLARKLRPVVKYSVNMLDRNNMNAGVQIWGMSKKMMTNLISYLEDPDYGDVTDVKRGHDLIIDKDSSGVMPKYEIRPRPKPTPLGYDDWEEELNMLDEVIGEEIDEDEIEEIIGLNFAEIEKSKKSKKKKDEEEDEEEDENEEGEDEDEDTEDDDEEDEEEERSSSKKGKGKEKKRKKK